MENIVELVTAIQQGIAICVTDGSYKTNYGTAALIILPHLDEESPLSTKLLAVATSRILTAQN